MGLRHIVIVVVLLLISIAVVLVTNWFLDGFIAWLAPGTSMTPEGDSLFALGIRAFFFIIDIVTIIAVFKWLRR